MKVFISHSSADQLMAAAFVHLLRTALDLRAGDIRCTSVDGYKLPSGTNFQEQLRQEVFQAETLVALLTPASLRSTFVLFELGARWSTERPLFAVRVGSLAPESLKGPLSTIHITNGSSEAEVADLLDTLSESLNVGKEKYAVFSHALKGFVSLSLNAAHSQSPTVEHAQNVGEESQHSNVGHILSPENLAEVPQRLLVTGRTLKLDYDFRPWLIVEAPNRQIYPQEPLTRRLGDWMQEVRIGRVEANIDKGYGFLVMLVAAGPDASYHFEKHLRNDSESKDGLGTLKPADMIVLDSRRVIRGD